jgi:ribosomal protein S27E
MTLRQVTVVEFADLRFIRVTCQHCQTQARLDLSAKLGGDRGAFMFLACPACRKPFDSAVQPAVNQFYEAYQRLAGAEKAVSFEVEGDMS